LLTFLTACHRPTSSPVQSPVKKTPPVIHSIGTGHFLQPVITEITKDNMPVSVKAGVPVTKKNSTINGVPFFTHIGVEQGLALNSVLCSALCKDGTLWFGTVGGGVCRYDGRNFSNYSLVQGLAANVVFSMLEDKATNMWFGTSSGISRFDGRSFTNYSTSDGLVGNHIVFIVEDRRGHLWFGSHEAGVSEFDGKYFKNYSVKDGLADNLLKCMLEDRKGNLWFGTEGGGISRYDGKKFTSLTIAQGLAGNTVNCMLEDKQGNLWFGCNKGLSKYDGLHFTNYTTSQGLSDDAITCMREDRAGNLWLGTQTKGLTQFNGNQFIHYTSSEGLTDNNVSSLLEDHTGNLWFTSIGGGGVTRFSSRGLTGFNETQGLINNVVLNIIQSQDSSLWLATYGGGISCYNGKIFSSFTTAQGLSDKLIWAVMQDRAGNLWFGTDHGGVDRFDGKTFTIYSTRQGLISNTVWSMMQDRSGNMWFGTDKGVSVFDGNKFTNYSPDQGLPGSNIQCILQDNSGDIWFGTHDNGLSRFDGKRFVNYTTTQGLASNTVYLSMKDRAGNLWFGTGNGASRYDGAAFLNISDPESTDNFTRAIAEDSVHQMMWLGTNIGLLGMKEDPITHQLLKNESEIFNKNTGYPINEIEIGALIIDRKGVIWAGSGHNKVIRFDYDAVGKRKSAAPVLQLLDIKINDAAVCWNYLLRGEHPLHPVDSLTVINEMVSAFGRILSPRLLDSMSKDYSQLQLDSVSPFYAIPRHLVLPHSHNSVTIDFAAIDPAMENGVQYQYKLEGYSNSWSTLSNRSSASFGNIPGGHYTFILRAVNTGGQWSEISYAFRVLSPWWFTWWAFLLYAAITASLLYFIYRNRVVKIERAQEKQLTIMVATQEQERRRISRDLHDEVGIKLSAIKLFLSSLLEKTSATKNPEIIQLARNSENLLTEVMQDVRQLLLDLSPLVLEEFGYVTAVQALVDKINETGQLQVNLTVFGMSRRMDKNYELALYRITQELINNVLKHAEAKRVTLQLGQRDEKMILMIEDDGKGFDQNIHSTGYGIQNLRARTKLMGGLMIIDSRIGKGSSVFIETPYSSSLA
jgi:signal transduction histidine kinase/ligand-binding sensor domain-containing protein